MLLKSNHLADMDCTVGDEQYGSRTQAKRVLLHSAKMKILDYEFNAREPKDIAKYK